MSSNRQVDVADEETNFISELKSAGDQILRYRQILLFKVYRCF